MIAIRDLYPGYRSLLWWSVAVQFILLLLASLSLDTGEMIYSFLYAAAAYWTGSILIVTRRPKNPTRWDIYFLRWALPILSLLSLFIVPWIWQTRS